MEAESSSRKLTNMTDEEDDSSGDDETPIHSRRRRFCNERQHEPRAELIASTKKFKPSDPNLASGNPNVFGKREKSAGLSKTPNIIPKRTSSRHQIPHVRHLGYRDRQLRTTPTDHPDQSSIKKTYRPQAGTPDSLFSSVPQQPVIHINPKFIQRFVEKSIKLSTQTNSPNVGQRTETSSNKIGEEGALQSPPIRNCPRNTLQAAAAMAIVRLVTECVEDDLQRNERMNKLLTSRLLEQLVRDEVTSEKQDVRD